MRVLLVGVEGSSRSADALAVAALLAPLLHAEPVLVHAHPYGDLSSVRGEGDEERLVRDVVESTRRQAESLFDRQCRPPARVIAARSPAAGLHAAARAPGVVAVVLGSSSRGPTGRVLPGGTAERLLAGAPCPVVVTPGGYGPRQPLGLAAVGVGFDGSAESEVALDVAASLAAANHGPLRVISVHERLVFGNLPVGLHRASVTVADQMRSDLAERLQAAVAALASQNVTPVFREGSGAEQLAEESAALGLLVVGSRAYGPIGSVLLGSTGTQLLRRSACPVMVVPRSAGARSARMPS